MDRNRVLLSEKKSAADFILGIDDRTVLERAKKDPNFPLYMYGKIQQGDALNRNRRNYPFEYLKKECIRYMEEEIAERQSYGELDHPETSAVPRLQFASHHIEDLSFKGKEVWAKIKVYNAFAGPGDNAGTKVRNIVLNGGRIGISSRALGSVEELENDEWGYYDEIQDDLALICWDLVSRPSTHKSNMHLVQEHLSKIKHEQITKQNKLILEQECFGDVCPCNCHIQEQKLKNLTESQKIYLKILGIEKFLQNN